MTARLWGIHGRPWIDLSPLIDTTGLAALDREICRGLAELDVGATGATLKWMGVVAPWQRDDDYRDAMWAIDEMSDDEWLDFVALADDPEHLTLADRPTLRFGDETDHPFTAAQVRLLTVRHGVYFPWKTCYHLLENDRWEDKHSGAGKQFDPEAERVLPRTVAFVRGLPFLEIGRAVIFGLDANDHAPLHRDTEPGSSLTVAQSISFAPRPGKRLYLQNDPDAEPTVIDAPAYWFNDMDYHGVLPDPFFRYSVRVDGVFTPAFARAIERHARGSR